MLALSDFGKHWNIGMLSEHLSSCSTTACKPWVLI